jgi:hypothetical protein
MQNDLGSGERVERGRWKEQAGAAAGPEILPSPAIGPEMAAADHDGWRVSGAQLGLFAFGAMPPGA